MHGAIDASSGLPSRLRGYHFMDLVPTLPKEGRGSNIVFQGLCLLVSYWPLGGALEAVPRLAVPLDCLCRICVARSGLPPNHERIFYEGVAPKYKYDGAGKGFWRGVAASAQTNIRSWLKRIKNADLSTCDAPIGRKTLHAARVQYARSQTHLFL